MSPVSEGESVVGKYKLLNTIATGQASQVFECIENGTPNRYAMKILLPEAFKVSANRSALKHEANVAKSLGHPNIIRYHELTVTRQDAYYVMELFKAPSLKAVIQSELHSAQMRFKRIVELISLALAHMHERGWIHKDLKPDNVLVSKGSEVKLIDFSLSIKCAGALSGLLGKSRVQGTRTYMAPEQIRGKPLGVPADIYSFGIMVFEMLTGRPPFQCSSPDELLFKHLSETPPAPSTFNPNVTPEMDRVVLRMLAKKPKNRQKTMNEVMAELRSVNPFREAIQAPETDDPLANPDLILGQRLDSRADALRRAAKAAAPAAPAAPATPAPARPPAAPVAAPPAARPPATGAPPRPPQGVPAGAPSGGPPGQRPPPPRPPQMPGAGQGGPHPGMARPPAPGLPPGVRPPGPLPPRPGVPAGPRPVGAPAAGPPPAGAPPRPPGPPGTYPARPPGPPGMPPANRPPAPGPGVPQRPGIPPMPGGNMPRPPGPPGPANAPRPGGPPGVPGAPPRPGMPPANAPRPPVPGAPRPPAPAPRPPSAAPPGGAAPPSAPRAPAPPKPGGPPSAPPPPAPGENPGLDDFNIR